LARSSSIDSTRLVLPSRIARTSRLSCSSSRLTLSGRSAESMTPLTKRRYDRHQRLGVVHDEDALDVQLHAGGLLAVPQVDRRLGRDVQQLRVLGGAFHAVVRPGQRVLVVVADLLVELLVLLGVMSFLAGSTARWPG
jgi:hypothetical protein